MILPYSLRLLCLLLLVCGALCAALQLILTRCAPFILRRLESLPARRRERALYRIQIAPALAALFIAATVCIPAYLRFEPTRAAENIGGVCLLLALAVALWIGVSLGRGLRTGLRTLRFTRACRRTGQALPLGGSTPVVALARTPFPVALLGCLRPLILISADLLASNRLHPDALDVALAHERSHARHRDNWKLLSLAFLPHLHRLLGDPWGPAWRTAADWAADDDAVHGDPSRSLLLAEALVHTARVAVTTRASARPVIHTALTSADAGLAARVDRLLHPSPVLPLRVSLLPSLAAALVLAALAAIATSPWIYPLSESLLHLGR